MLGRKLQLDCVAAVYSHEPAQILDVLAPDFLWPRRLRYTVDIAVSQSYHVADNVQSECISL